MGALFDLLGNLFDIVQQIFTFAIDFTQDLIQVALLVADTLLTIPTFIQLLFPETIGLILSALIGVTAIYRIAGRD